VEKVNTLRAPIKKLENNILESLIKELGNNDYEFEDQNRNISVNCCVCNDKPNYSLMVCGEFTHVYFCYECRKKLTNIMSNNIKGTTIENLKANLKEYSDSAIIYRPRYDEKFQYAPLHLKISYVFAHKNNKNIFLNSVPYVEIENYEKCLILSPNPCNKEPMMDCKKESTCQIMTVGKLRSILNDCPSDMKILRFSNYSDLNEYRKIDLQPWTIYIDKTGIGDSIEDIEDFNNYYDTEDDVKLSNYEKHACLF
jgi:hypothetical protein